MIDVERARQTFSALRSNSRDSLATPFLISHIAESLATLGELVLEIHQELGHRAPESPDPYGGRKPGDLCPECGVAALAREEGCEKCWSCGYSRC